MSDERDPYRVLGLDHASEPEVVATAYRALARSHHPDVSREVDAESRMAEINAAWTILRDPERRAAYDREHGITDGLGESRRANPLRAMQQRAKASPGGAVDGTGTAAASAGSATAPHASGWRRGPNGEGAAGPPPGRPKGSVLTFGRHIGWSLGEIARVDPGYLQWLAARPEGRPFQDEIGALLEPLIRTADGHGFANAPEPTTTRRTRFRR